MFDKPDFKSKLARRNQECHFILIEGRIHQQDITLVKIHTSNAIMPNFLKEILRDIKAQTDQNTIKVFNTPLSSVDSSFKENQQKNFRSDLTGIHKTLLPVTAEYNILLSSLWCFLQNISYFWI
jgi:hypothetical protein